MASLLLRDMVMGLMWEKLEGVSDAGRREGRRAGTLGDDEEVNWREKRSIRSR